MHPFDAAVALTANGDGLSTGATSPAYANMVGPFGGTTAAVLLNAALSHPQRAGTPIALTVNYASATADGAFDVAATPVRLNRSTQHWRMELRQAGEVVANATAVFAQRRETWSVADVVMPSGIPAPDGLARVPAAGRPPWVAHYDLRFARGNLPQRWEGEVQPDAESVVWMRDDPPRPLDFLSLAALSDAFFPRVYLRRNKVVPIGTVSLTTYFHADEAQLAAHADGYLLGAARALAFRNGYFDQRGELWTRRGELLASTQQMVYYRE